MNQVKIAKNSVFSQTAVLRTVWLVVAVVVVGLVITAVPYRYQMLVEDVYGFGSALASIGLSLSFFAAYFVFWELVVITGSLLVAGIIVWRRANDPFVMLVAITLTLLGLLPPLVDGLIFLNPLWQWPVVALRVAEMVCMMAVFCLFPNGRFQPQWTRWLFVGWLIMLATAHLLKPDVLADTAVLPNTRTLADAFYLLVGVGWFMAAIGGQIVRYHRLATSEEQQQTKWVLVGFVMVILFSLISTLLLINVPFFRDNPQGRILFILVMGALYLLSALLLPITIALAMLRYRLWEVDIIINRTLVYGGLTALVLIIYVVLVGGLSSLFQSQNSLLISLLVTGLIAVLFQPVRSYLQQGVNRLMFGERDDPYGVLSKLGRRLQETAVPGQTLPAITATICQSLKLPYAAIIIQTADGGRQTVAASGPWTPILSEWPLLYQGKTIGWLAAAPRAPGETFTGKEQQLLADIAAQTGPVAHSVRLTTALQTAREKLVLTREEERRRIRRDLHDELGPSLASQTFKLDAALDLLESDPQAAADLLQALKAQNQSLVGDIRQLVYALRPPALDELGLAGALQAHVAQINGRNTHITLDTQPEQLRFLPAAVEVAAYRIALEGINNVLRHANAQNCVVSLKQSSDRLTLQVRDDGRGVPPQANGGVGFSSMRERVEELGGQLTIQANQPAGTVITAVFPTGGPYEQIVPATAEDLPLVMGIIGEAAAWLKEKGIDQWPSPPNQHWWRRTAAFIEKGEMHIAYQDSAAIGILRLNWADTYWPDDGMAGYVHGLAIRSRAHGRGVGQALLVWAEGEIRQRERPFLRLDCATGNGRLRQYYEDQGFTYHGQVTDHDYVAALYEVEVT